ncbi:HNH endonuclease [Halobacteriovorax sp. YZS-1-1]|uniref:HNH endonuclease n=1 Tax=unclassified Halobacteriovorax TaxID=2639665 RepID=UPI00399BB4AB
MKRQKIFSRSKYEHREIAEKTLGRKLEDGEVVHHIDFVKDNNCLDNLCVMSDRDHRHYHNWHRWMEKNKPNVDLSISYRKKKLREKWSVIILDEIDLKK